MIGSYNVFKYVFGIKNRVHFFQVVTAVKCRRLRNIFYLLHTRYPISMIIVQTRKVVKFNFSFLFVLKFAIFLYRDFSRDHKNVSELTKN